MGTDDIWTILPDTYIPNRATATIYPTSWFFDKFRNAASLSTTIWPGQLYTPQGTKFSKLPQVQILYTNLSEDPGVPTSETIGLRKTWNRDIDNAEWCAYRYKVDGEWTNWTVESVTF